MSRQHSAPVLLRETGAGAVQLQPLSLGAGIDAVAEIDIQALIHSHPGALPIAEIDPAFLDPVPICMELNTSAGAIDNFMVTAAGFPVLVECKLWRNPEGRREVVGQILDYAKELSRWSSADLQREVRVRLKATGGNPLFDLVRAGHPEVDEVAFNDALTLNLRRGRFLLLIVGDGIRGGVEAIAEYLQAHAGLHFSLGLVELPFYRMPDGSRLVVPRVLAKTAVIVRHVVAVPEGFSIEGTESALEPEKTADRSDLHAERHAFWSEFLTYLRLDDPEQRIPNASRQGYISFMFPAPQGTTSWLTVYRDLAKNEVGVFLSSNRSSAGEYATRVIASDWTMVREQLGGTASLGGTDERPEIRDVLKNAFLETPEGRVRAFKWLAERINTFVNVLRPRVRSAIADYVAET